MKYQRSSPYANNFKTGKLVNKRFQNQMKQILLQYEELFNGIESSIFNI